MTLLFKLKNLQAASGTWFLYQIVKPTNQECNTGRIQIFRIIKFQKRTLTWLQNWKKQNSQLTKKVTLHETITKLAQYELSQEESDLLKAGLYFSIQPDKIRKSEIFTTFKKITRSFINNIKSEETKS